MLWRPTCSFAFLKTPSMSSSGCHTRGTPWSSYLKRSSKWFRSLLRTTASAVCSSILARRHCQARLRKVISDETFSSSVQLKPKCWFQRDGLEQWYFYSLLALTKYAFSPLARMFLNVLRISSHMFLAPLLSWNSTGSEICFLIFRCKFMSNESK